MRATLLAAFAFLFAGGAAHAVGRIPVRVVVVTTFELGADTGDKPGEFQAWVERLPLSTVLAFPQGYHPLRFNASLGVLGMVSGEGPARMAASMTALGDDPRLDLSHAYFVLAGIAGIDPAAGSVASAAWAKHVVTGEAHEIDAREIPPGWSTGYVPLGRSMPFAQPVPEASGVWGTSMYTLDAGLVDWAYHLTRNVVLADSAPLQAIRKRYTQEAARRPPFVLEGDTLASGIFWVGGRMNDWAEQWVRYWTRGQGVFATTAEEDGGMMQALTFLSQAHKVDLARVLVLRTASNFDMPPPGEGPAALLAQENGGAGYSAYVPSLDSAYRVASPVVLELATHWSRYRDHVPGR